MSSNYSDVVVVNAPHIAQRMALKLSSLPSSNMREAFAGSKESGYFYLFGNEEFPDMVYECVPSLKGGDAIAAVYMTNRIFGSVGNLISARADLIKRIAESVGLSVEGVGIDDAARGRSLDLDELSTGQLIDMLNERSNTGKIIVASNSHVLSPK